MTDIVGDRHSGVVTNVRRSDGARTDTMSKLVLLGVSMAVALIYYNSNPRTTSPFDYTLRIASALLHGSLGDKAEPPVVLSEMIPLNQRYYSAFPLGSVLTMVPIALLKEVRLVGDFPGAALAAISAAVTAWFLWLLSARYQQPLRRRLVLTCFPLLGTWMWANLAFGGAWQIALGIAVAAQVAALYYTVERFRPLAAGLCFALAFGNRTEVILLAPIFLLLVWRRVQSAALEGAPRLRAVTVAWMRFSAGPFALGLATLAYNFARFGSVLDFGYARIPGVLDEPWYAHGIFSLHAIPGNVREMLLTPWKRLPEYPYLVPTGFGGSIFLTSPYLLFVFRPGARDRALKKLAWTAIGLLTFALWCHGNPGGWQFSYRYAMILLPWVFVLLSESSPRRVTHGEIALVLASIGINAYGAFLFLRTSYMQP